MMGGGERMKIWKNGIFVPWKKATTHFLTHSLHYSGAVYEGIRCYKTKQGPAIFRLEDHIKRLLNSARIIDMEHDWRKEELQNACIDLVKENKMEECYIRPLLYYGAGEMGINTVGKKADAEIAVWKWGAYLGEGREKGVRVVTSTWRKAAPDAMPLHAKVSGNYTVAILAKKEAIKKGCDEAILLDPSGCVAEGPGENIFAWRKGTLLTPPTTYALEGITRDTVIALAKERRIPLEVKVLTRDECYTVDELFFTGTAAEITPIVEYDERKIGDGKVGELTKTFQQMYFSLVHGETQGKMERLWLTYV